MNLDKYQQAWKADASDLSVTIDFDSLLAQVKQSHDYFRSTIFWRDVREVGVCVALIPLSIAMGIGFSLPWAWWLEIPALIWVAGFMLIDRRRHPDSPSLPGQPLLFYAKESLSQVEHQIWLLRNVFWWYLFPFVISTLAFFIHVGWDISQTWWGCLLFAAPFGLFVFWLYRWIYRLNQTAVTEQLLPRRDHLRSIISKLEKDDDDDPAAFGDLVDHISAISPTDQQQGANPGLSSWSENWDRLVPSWSIAGMILLPALIGGYCAYRFGDDRYVPVFFQTALAIVIPFEIMFFGRCYYVSKKGCETLSNQGRTTRKHTALPHAPAIFVLVLVLAAGALAFAALYSFVSHAKSNPSQPVEAIDWLGPLKTEDGFAKVAPYSQVRWEDGLPITRVDGDWLRLRSIDDILIEDILSFCREKYGPLAEKRFTEDLVQVLFEMGHEPEWDVALGYETDEATFETRDVRMTRANRSIAQLHHQLQMEKRSSETVR